MNSVRLFLIWIIVVSVSISCSFSRPVERSRTKVDFEVENIAAIPAAERTYAYFPLLEGKRIAIAGNHTSLIGAVHLVDSLQNAGFHVEKVFSPEHGFRGTAPDGAYVASGIDEQTGIKVVSLYGARRRPNQEELAGIDLILVDMQDVGARFYTYISTMTLVMQEAAKAQVQVIVLDRPNPMGHFVDGPVLDLAFSSFVGMHPVPVVHGMTIGEFALMINGQGWLGGGLKANLKVIPVANYSRCDFYQLPVPPSPNLPNMRAIYLYPSLCFFEGTTISVGRGTAFPFQVFGSPNLPADRFTFSFTPQSVAASTNPPLLNQACFGRDLRTIPIPELQARRQIDLSYLLEAFRSYPNKENFFNPFFDRLAGTNLLRNQIKAGLSEEQIRLSWKPGLEAFRKIRAKYLIYPDCK
ncbi:MAG TPA: DUF1343 domain-containing protein [Bacteroidales bacterium]|nr:DUF1343 domain-containing protein [Bacteroidales bacterium]